MGTAPIHSITVDDLLVEWSHQDQAAAEKEGWWLCEDSARLCADEGAPFELDAQAAIDHVVAKATAGSDLHIRAMILEHHSARRSWADRLEETR